jgi:hypothetical protein
MHTSGRSRRSRRKRRSRRNTRWMLALVACVVLAAFIGSRDPHIEDPDVVAEEADQEDESAIVSAPEEPADEAGREESMSHAENHSGVS